ncbi:hypothetical protein GGR53DRAFT_471840 [Hypoxylon sp. FL1150]|nr:hypothetical protein GGR53DRAFT_471840 [Hypoxylon sp. FL1150]
MSQPQGTEFHLNSLAALLRRIHGRDFEDTDLYSTKQMVKSIPCRPFLREDSKRAIAATADRTIPPGAENNWRARSAIDLLLAFQKFIGEDYLKTDQAEALFGMIFNGVGPDRAVYERPCSVALKQGRVAGFNYNVAQAWERSPRNLVFLQLMDTARPVNAEVPNEDFMSPHFSLVVYNIQHSATYCFDSFKDDSKSRARWASKAIARAIALHKKIPITQVKEGPVHLIPLFEQRDQWSCGFWALYTAYMIIREPVTLMSMARRLLTRQDRGLKGLRYFFNVIVTGYLGIRVTKDLTPPPKSSQGIRMGSIIPSIEESYFPEEDDRKLNKSAVSSLVFVGEKRVTSDVPDQPIPEVSDHEEGSNTETEKGTKSDSSEDSQPIVTRSRRSTVRRGIPDEESMQFDDSDQSLPDPVLGEGSPSGSNGGDEFGVVGDYFEQSDQDIPLMSGGLGEELFPIEDLIDTSVFSPMDVTSEEGDQPLYEDTAMGDAGSEDQLLSDSEAGYEPDHDLSSEEVESKDVEMVDVSESEESGVSDEVMREAAEISQLFDLNVRHHQGVNYLEENSNPYRWRRDTVQDMIDRPAPPFPEYWQGWDSFRELMDIANEPSHRPDSGVSQRRQRVARRSREAEAREAEAMEESEASGSEYEE